MFGSFSIEHYAFGADLGSRRFFESLKSMVLHYHLGGVRTGLGLLQFYCGARMASRLELDN
jgi:hypothetical protein